MAPPPPAQAPTDLPSLWALVAERIVGAKPSFAWLRFLRLDRIEGDTAVLAITPGHREIEPLATPQRLEAVGAELTALRGTRTRVVLDAGRRESSHGSSPEPANRATASPGAAPPTERRSAMQIPLVKAALEHFPDAMLIEVRDEAEAESDVADDPETPTPTDDTDEEPL